MEVRHDELRDELVAILGAGRELTAETDTQLAEAFVRFLRRQQEHETTNLVPPETPHQPHYSLLMAGGAWGAALMFLLLLLLLDNPDPSAFIAVAVVLLGLIAALTRAFLYMARYGWRLPRIHVAPPARKPHSRG